MREYRQIYRRSREIPSREVRRWAQRLITPPLAMRCSFLLTGLRRGFGGRMRETRRDGLLPREREGVGIGGLASGGFTDLPIETFEDANFAKYSFL